MCDPPRIYPSLPEYTPFLTTICVPPRIYPSIPEYNPLLNKFMCATFPESSPPRIYPPFQQLYATLTESTPPSQNIPPFATTIISCDSPRIYPSLQEYTPLSTTICDPPRFHPSLPEYTLIFNNHFIMQRSQNLSLPPRIYPPFNNSMRPSQTLPSPQRIHPSFMTTICPPPSLSWYIPRPLSTIFQESTPQSLETTCIFERMYHSSHNWKIFWVCGEDFGRIAKSYSSWKGGGVYSERQG